jgi:hypothetical protein
MPDRRRAARNPDTIVLLASLAVAGLGLTLAGVPPFAVMILVPKPLALAWSAVLGVAAALALAGVLWRDELIGWSLEVGGRIGVACTTAAYAIALVDAWAEPTLPGPAPVDVITVTVIAGITVSCVARLWVLVRRWREYWAIIHQARDRQ